MGIEPDLGFSEIMAARLLQGTSFPLQSGSQSGCQSSGVSTVHSTVILKGKDRLVGTLPGYYLAHYGGDLGV